jgi:uncharacterized protein involved in outer membrane biogenesis
MGMEDRDWYREKKIDWNRGGLKARNGSTRRRQSMKKGRIFLIIAAVLLLAIGGAIYYVFSNINFIVKDAIEKYGSLATKTPVRVSSVDIQLSSGAASIAGVTVANPNGFSAPNIFSLGNISTRIDPKSVTKSPVVIENIRITGPEVFYEMNKSGKSNLDALTKNLQGPEKKPIEKKEKKEVKLSIRKLVIEKGRVEALVAALGEKPIMVELPRLELANLGGKSGATPEEIATTVSLALAEQTAKAVARTQAEKYLKKGAEGLLKRYLE